MAYNKKKKYIKPPKVEQCIGTFVNASATYCAGSWTSGNDLLLIANRVLRPYAELSNCNGAHT